MSLLSLIEEYLDNIKPGGGENILASCPFHGADKNPSFSVNVLSGACQCFACGWRGNVQKMLLDMGLPRAEVEGLLGDITGLEVQNAVAKRFRKLIQGKNKSSNLLRETLLAAFDRCPDALVKKGFTKKTLKHFETGVDIERRRVTHPIRNKYGQLVGIAGRYMEWTPDSGVGKYKVYQEELRQSGYPNYSEPTRQHLWNFHRVIKMDVREIIIVEGYKACMWIHQAGAPNVVALMGSSITEEQLAMIQGKYHRYLIFLDNNKAGLLGTVRVARKLGSDRSYVCSYPEWNDNSQPDDLTGPDALDSISRAQTYLSWRIKHASELSLLEENRPELGRGTQGRGRAPEMA